MIEPEWLWGVKQFWRILIYRPEANLAWLISGVASLALLGFSVCFLAPVLEIAKRVTGRQSE